MGKFANRTITLTGLIAMSVGGLTGVAGAVPSYKDEPSAAVPRFDSVDFVDGFDAYTDDWSDHEREIGALGEGGDDSDTVLLWQSVLAADGYLTGAELSRVQGTYGTETARATRAWKYDNGLPEVDGAVDGETWAAADDRLAWRDGRLTYADVDHDGFVAFTRGDDGAGAYTLISVTADDLTVLDNVTGADRIEHFKRTIGLE